MAVVTDSAAAAAVEVIKMGFICKCRRNARRLYHDVMRRAETVQIYPGAIVFVAVVTEKKIIPVYERRRRTQT